MKNYYPIALLLCCLLTALSCTSPTDPMHNYSNAEATPLLPDNPQVSVDETVDLDVRLKLPHLADYIIVSINDDDTTVVCRYEFSIEDTVRIQRVFSEPDTVRVHYLTVYKNGSEEEDTCLIVVNGFPPEITEQPDPVQYISEDAPCTLSAAAQGSEPFEFQWYKDEEKITEGDSRSLVIPSFSHSDTGFYTCIVSNEWGQDTSEQARLALKPLSGKEVFWNFASYSDSVSEGDSLLLEIKELYTKPADASVQFAVLKMEEKCGFSDDSLFVFRAGHLDSGLYEIPVVISSETESDTARIHVNVLPSYLSLGITADSGEVSVTPVKDAYRWGDTVQLEAVALEGYVFYEWDGDLSGTDTEKEIIIRENTSVIARFWPASSAGCNVLEPGSSINQQMRASAPASQRPKLLCPEAGLYEEGTVEVHGNVRFVIQ